MRDYKNRENDDRGYENAKAFAEAIQAMSDSERQWVRDFVARYLAVNRHERPSVAIELAVAALGELKDFGA